MSCENINVGNGQVVTFAGGNIDAFGRLRTSSPLTIFDSKNVMSKNNLFDESTTSGGTVTYTSNKSTVNLNVTEASGSKTIRQSKRVMSYQPGKSLLIMNTFVMNTPTANLKQSTGLFDANNGIFFLVDGTTYKIVRRTYTSGAAVDTEISQSNWNGDKLNGTGLSGFNLDLSRMQMLYLDYSWYGAGFIRWGFRGQDGTIIYCHKIPNNNVNTEAYMRSGNLPARYETNTFSRYAILANTALSVDSSITLSDTTGWPSSGTVLLRNSTQQEYINYSGITGNTLTGCTRGQSGSTQTFTTVANSAVITGANTVGLQIGQYISGSGIPAGAYVVSFVANTSAAKKSSAERSDAEAVDAPLTAASK